MNEKTKKYTYIDFLKISFIYFFQLFLPLSLIGFVTIFSLIVILFEDLNLIKGFLLVNAIYTLPLFLLLLNLAFTLYKFHLNVKIRIDQEADLVYFSQGEKKKGYGTLDKNTFSLKNGDLILVLNVPYRKGAKKLFPFPVMQDQYTKEEFEEIVSYVKRMYVKQTLQE